MARAWWSSWDVLIRCFGAGDLARGLAGLFARGFAGDLAAGFAGLLAAGFAGLLAAGFLAARAGDLALGFAGLLAAGFFGGMLVLSALLTNGGTLGARGCCSLCATEFHAVCACRWMIYLG